MTDLIGIATWDFTEGALAERIDRFVAMGYNAVSLSVRDARALCGGETPDVEDAIARHCLLVTIHGGLAPKGEPIAPDSILADFRSFTDWHIRTGALASINFDAAKKQTDTGAWEPRCDEMHGVLAEMLSISAGAGFTVGIEDWPLTVEHQRVVEDLRVYPHYGMLIDLGHLNMRIRKTDDPDYPFPIDAAREYLERLALPLNELHIHNNDGKHDLHAALTTGTSDLRALANLLTYTGKLASAGPKLVSTIELVPAWCGLTQEQGHQAAREALAFWRSATTTENR